MNILKMLKNIAIIKVTLLTLWYLYFWN